MEEIRALARPLASGSDLDPLLDSIGSSRFVLLGEASHGTSEYYSWRADITRRLIAEKGFSFVAVEGDWPDCYRVNRWVKHRSDHGRTAREVLGDFERWPAWMWANEEVAAFLGRLRDHNRASRRPAGFYGLDVYSLWESLDTVLEYLKAEHPDALETAKQAVRCFEPFGEDTSKYARSAGMVPSSCEKQVVDLLRSCVPIRLGSPTTPKAASTPARTPRSLREPSVTTGRCWARTPTRGTSATTTWPTRSTA
jgi:erythromycin esterase